MKDQVKEIKKYVPEIDLSKSKIFSRSEERRVGKEC